MLQGGFAIFFLLAMALAIVSMLFSLRDNVEAILDALAGTPPPERALPQASMWQRPTAEMPHVARRLGSLVDERLAPVAETPRIWCFRRDPGLHRAA